MRMVTVVWLTYIMTSDSSQQTEHAVFMSVHRVQWQRTCLEAVILSVTSVQLYELPEPLQREQFARSDLIELLVPWTEMHRRL